MIVHKRTPLQAVKMTVGKRLKEERQRLGMSQEAFGKAGGVGKGAQINYEADSRSADTDYLQGIDKVGADILYVVVGKRRIDMASTEMERGLLQQAFDYVLQTKEGSLVIEGKYASDPEASSRLAHMVQERYDDAYSQAAQSAHHPGIPLTDQERSLLDAYAKASGEGKKVIERIAQLEAVRGGSPTPPTPSKTFIKGHGNAMGTNITMGSVVVGNTKTKKR